MDISSQSRKVLERLLEEKLKPVLTVTNNLRKNIGKNTRLGTQERPHAETSSRKYLVSWNC
jgi:hypothetical protein